MPRHPDAEDLSAYFDGEAPELGAHVERCDTCQAAMARLGAVSERVGAPVEPADPGAFDAMISGALGAAAGAGEDELTARRRREPRRWLAVASVAAVVVVAVGVAAALAGRSGSGGTSTKTDLAGGPVATTAIPGLAPPEVTGGEDGVIGGGALGDVANASVLASKAGPGLAGVENPGATAGDNPVLGQSGAGDSGLAPRARAVGTRACELQARAVDPGAGPVVYVATATQSGAPATVLGFAPPGGGRPITLFLMAQDDCRLLARATVP